MKDLIRKQIFTLWRIPMILLGILVLGIGGYLIYALIHPEKF